MTWKNAIKVGHFNGVTATCRMCYTYIRYRMYSSTIMCDMTEVQSSTCMYVLLHSKLAVMHHCFAYVACHWAYFT